MKIAVIGSGMAGLSAAWLCQQGGHRVTLYERQQAIGMDAHAVEFALHGETYRVDVPLRTFHAGNWSNLVRWCDTLKIETQTIDSATALREKSHSFSELTGQTLFAYHKSVLGQLYLPVPNDRRYWNRVSLQILYDMARFKRASRQDSVNPQYAALTLREYLTARGYSAPFIQIVLYPALATICTCSYANLDRYPASVILTALHNILGYRLRRVQGGISTLIQRLTQSLQTIHCQTQVTRLTHTDNQAVVRTMEGETAGYDHVIVATQANHACALLDPALSAEIKLLQKFPYDAVTVVVHRDRRFMPQRLADWAPLNYFLTPQRDNAMSTVWMNCLEPHWPRTTPVLQTINPLFAPAPATIMGQTRFERAIVNQESLQALAQLTRLQQQPHRRIWFCGAYADPGIPMLESALCSSLAVAQRLGVPCPWDPTWQHTLVPSWPTLPPSFSQWPAPLTKHVSSSN